MSRVFAAWNNNVDVLLKSTSGGVFSLIAEAVLSDGGIVVGAAIDSVDQRVNHVFVDDKNALESLRGSKYHQSNIGTSMRRVKDELRNNRLVLFSGTPCQVAGLYRYLETEKVDTSKLYTVDVLCHGVTSYIVVSSYIKSMEARFHKKVSSIKFRTKELPWYKSGSSMTLFFDDGTKEIIHNLKDRFYIAYNNNIILRPSCYSCRYTKMDGRNTDFTIADYWGAEDRVTSKEALRNGVSIVMVHNEKAEQLLNRLEGKMTTLPVDTSTITRRNGAFVSPVPCPPDRDEIMEELSNKDFFQCINTHRPKTIRKNMIKYVLGYDNCKRISKIKRRIKKADA